MSVTNLALLRHGESEWNRDGRFTGWTDIDLSAAGAAEAERAGRLLQHGGYRFDCCFTSVLRRATRSSEIVLHAMGLGDIPVEQTWRLNERHYGALQGMGLWRAAQRYGLLHVLRCQRQFAVRPPALETSDPRFPGLDPLYASLSADELPRAESLADTLARLIPYWQQRIVPELTRGRHVLIVSHKNALRALVKLLDRRADAEVRRIRVPTGVPIVFALDAGLTVVERRVLRGTEGALAPVVATAR